MGGAGKEYHMNLLNWHEVESPEAFAVLATSIVEYNFPGAVEIEDPVFDDFLLFRSADGSTVISRNGRCLWVPGAMDFVKCLTEFRRPGHPRYEEWRSVRRFCTLTCMELSHTSREQWLGEVVPAFQRIGIVAECWDRPEIDRILDKSQAPVYVFLMVYGRDGLSWKESQRLVIETTKALPHMEPFLSREVLTPFVGRSSEIQAIRRFMESDKQFLVVHGTAGSGKTRLLVEAGDQIAQEGNWIVLWEMGENQTRSWPSERATKLGPPNLLLVDRLPSDLFSWGRDTFNRPKILVRGLWKMVVTTRCVDD